VTPVFSYDIRAVYRGTRKLRWVVEPATTSRVIKIFRYRRQAVAYALRRKNCRYVFVYTIHGACQYVKLRRTK
jgi:hypothetical protein